jgi:hypothetical protein
MLSPEDLKLFKFKKVLGEIRNSFDSLDKRQDLLLVIHFDEVQHIGNSLLKLVLSECANHMLQGSSPSRQRICLLPVITGTSVIPVLSAITFSRLSSNSLLLGSLKPEQIWEILVAKYGQHDIFQNRYFITAIDCLGQIPRFLEFFTQEMSILDDKITPIHELLKRILEKVRDRIKETYGTPYWNQVFSGMNPTQAILNLCHFAIQQIPLYLSTKLNGITVEQAKESGIIFLKHQCDGTKPTMEECNFSEHTFVIDMPLILLRALNLSFEFVEDELFNVVTPADPNTFERLLATIIIFRCNILSKVFPNLPIHIKDIYLGAIGNKDDLEMLVELKPLKRVLEAGSSSTHDSIHKHDLQSIPIQYSQSPIVNLLEGNVLIMNVDKANFGDSAMVHVNSYKKINEQQPLQVQPLGNLVVIHQYKSSEGIRSGKNTSTTLKYKQLMEEHEKVFNNKDCHPSWKLIRKLLVVITNKPSEVQNQKIPENTIIISNENFKLFAGPFATSNIFFPVRK